MPRTRTVETANRDGFVQFTEDDHSYIVRNKLLGTEKRLISVTTLVSQYFPKFNADLIAPKVAANRGVSAEQVKAEWERIRDEASRYGTRVHEYMEDVLNGVKHFRNTPENAKEVKAFQLGSRFARQLKETVDQFESEKMICDVNLGIAGTIDLLCRDATDGGWSIFDWKTNAKINMKSQYGKHGLYPIEHLDDCEYAHYCLQLNIYDRILHTAGYFPKNTYISKYLVHIDVENGLKLISVPNMNHEVDLILNDFISRKN